MEGTLMKTKKTFYSGIVVIIALMVIGVWTFDDTMITDNVPNTRLLGNTVSQLVSARPVFAQYSGDNKIADVAEKTVVSVVNIASTQIISSPGGIPRHLFQKIRCLSAFLARSFSPTNHPNAGRTAWVQESL